MTDQEILIDVIRTLKKENKQLKENLRIERLNYQELHKAYNKLLKFLEDK